MSSGELVSHGPGRLQQQISQQIIVYTKHFVLFKMPKKTTGELIKLFGTNLEKADIIGTQNKVLEAVQNGPIQKAREKLRALKFSEASEVIRSTGLKPEDIQAVQDEIYEIFDEEVAKAEQILKTAMVSILKLDELIEEINHSFVKDLNSPEGSKLALLSQCYEDCRTILTFLKLRNKLLKHALLVPPETLLTSSPIPPDLEEEQEQIIYLQCKIQHAPFV